jgi:hypothetical protein
VVGELEGLELGVVTHTARLETASRPFVYMASSAERKEQKVRQIMAADGVKAGLICVLSCVEPCFSYQVHRNREKKHIELQGGNSKCLHHYFYFQDPVRGFMHLRLQTYTERAMPATQPAPGRRIAKVRNSESTKRKLSRVICPGLNLLSYVLYFVLS